jgi:hypothetical protein
MDTAQVNFKLPARFPSWPDTLPTRRAPAGAKDAMRLRMHLDPPLGGAPTAAAPDAESTVFRAVLVGDPAAAGWCVELWHDGGGEEAGDEGGKGGEGEGAEYGSERRWRAAQFEELPAGEVKAMVRLSPFCEYPPLASGNPFARSPCEYCPPFEHHSRCAHTIFRRLR